MYSANDSNSNYLKRVHGIRHYMSVGQIDQAKKLLGQLLSENPLDAELLYLLACCNYELEKYEEAMDCCIKALNNGFSVEQCNLLMAQINVRMGCLVEAEKHFLETLRVNPQNAEAMAAYGYLMLKTGHEKKAAKLMEEALRLDPADEAVLNYNFYFYLSKNRHDDQLNILTQIYQVSDSEVRKLVNTGLLNLFKGDHRTAQEALRQAFLLDPANKDLLFLLEEVTREAHPVFLPMRLVNKMGGPAVIWIVFIAVLILLNLLKLPAIAVIVAFFYLIYVVYSWTAPLVYKLVKRC